MPASLNTQCPQCSKILKLKTEAMIGKTVPCPKCKNPFKVVPYTQTEQDDEWGDDYGNEEDFQKQPVRRSSSKKRKKKSKRKSSGVHLPKPVIGGMVIGFLLIAGCVIYYAVQISGDLSKSINIAIKGEMYTVSNLPSGLRYSFGDLISDDLKNLEKTDSFGENDGIGIVITKRLQSDKKPFEITVTNEDTAETEFNYEGLTVKYGKFYYRRNRSFPTWQIQGHADH